MVEMRDFYHGWNMAFYEVYILLKTCFQPKLFINLGNLDCVKIEFVGADKAFSHSTSFVPGFLLHLL